MSYRSVVVGVALLFTSVVASAASADLLYPPKTSAGHDFNHAPIGQSFKALASRVKAGIYIADGNSFTNWLATIYPGQIQPGSYPYTITSPIKVRVELLQGEGVGGGVLHSRTIDLNYPFSGFLEFDYAAVGITLDPGQQYTLLVTDVSGQTYPNGVTGWIVPSVHDFNTGASLASGAYPDGRPILQGALMTDDAGIGDNAFDVLDVGSSSPPISNACIRPKGTKASKGKGIVAAVGENYIMINSKHIDYASCTSMHYGGYSTAPVVGDRVEWQGFVEANGNIMAQTLTFN